MSEPFNLEQAIAGWRRRMAAGGIRSLDVLEELESHLRDELEQQIRSGSSASKAFETAVERIGRPHALKTEFAMADRSASLFPRSAVWLLPVLVGVACVSCWAAFGRSPAVASVYCLLLAGLIAASLIDVEHFLIPDRVSVGGILVGLLCSALLPQLHGQPLATGGLLQSLLGIGAGAGLVYLVLRAGKLLFGRQRVPLPAGGRVVFTETGLLLPEQEIAYDDLFYRRSDAVELQARTAKLADRCYENVPIRLTPVCLEVGKDKFEPREASRMEAVGSEVVLPREAMGFGDVKLMAAVGAFLGWQAVVFALAASSLVGSLVGLGLAAARRRDWSARLPYGPFIAVGATIWIFGGKHILDALFAR